MYGQFTQLKNEKLFLQGQSTVKLNEITVIIPFRNEENRISTLISCIQQLTDLPKQFIFVNDHSEDQGSEFIQTLSDKIPFVILNLPKGQYGKKSALRYGIEAATTTYILTWDADISLKKDYFSRLSTLVDSDLFVLPVVMKGRTFSQRFFEADHSIANAINTSVSGIIRPFLASGANLLFKRNSFQQFDAFEDHAHISSGDDLFLLRDFRENAASIQLISNPNFSVETPSPFNWSEFISQRLRWIGKSGKVKDQLSNTLALLAFLFNSGFYLLLITSIVQQNHTVFIVVFLGKNSIDWVVYFHHFWRTRRMITWILLPVFSVLQPIYLLTLTCLVTFHKPNWKGRKIQ